jgi:hypothetical protein
MPRPVAATEPPVSPVVAPPDRERLLEEENSRLKLENVDLKRENVDLRVDNRGLTKTVGSLSGEISAFGKERREMQAERKTFMAQIGELTTRVFQLQAGRERPAPEPVKAEIVHERVIDVTPPPSTQSPEQKVDNSASEIIS